MKIQDREHYKLVCICADRYGNYPAHCENYQIKDQIICDRDRREELSPEDSPS
jgi:hypothetical protein